MWRIQKRTFVHVHPTELKSACASAQSDQSIDCPHKKLCILGYQKGAQWRFWSDCANAQADLNLLWAHMSEGMFSDYVDHLFWPQSDLSIYSSEEKVIIFFFFFFLYENSKVSHHQLSLFRRVIKMSRKATVTEHSLPVTVVRKTWDRLIWLGSILGLTGIEIGACKGKGKLGWIPSHHLPVKVKSLHYGSLGQWCCWCLYGLLPTRYLTGDGIKS